MINQTYNKWNLSTLPPKDDKDVGPFFAKLVKDGDNEKIRLGLEDRWKYNHRMFRGDHWGNGGGLSRKNLKKFSLNLIFANIQRTVANLTAKQPTVEAVETGGPEDGVSYDKILTAWLHKWWSDSLQEDTIVDLAYNMELYGAGIDKYIYRKNTAGSIVVDQFAFGKAPGVYDSIQDCPYVYHKVVMRLDEIEELYGLEEGTVKADDVYSIMGEDREEAGPKPNVKAGSVAYSNSSNNVRTKYEQSNRAVVTEVWVKDYSGEYKDKIRVVTYVNEGAVVLSDSENPNINWKLYEKDPRLVQNTFLFGRYPFNLSLSYRDNTTNWGFSALEQTADINEVIDEIVSRLYAYISKSMLPVLVVPKDTGITPAQINNKPGLILRPTSSSTSAGIRYLDPPRVSLDVYKFLDIIRGLFDQIWHIEDADRGERPSGIIAAQAIQALQERNAVLMRAKIRSIDNCVEGRGRAAISFMQNFGFAPESINMGDESAVFSGIDLAGRDFDYIVESGSTVHKTTMQVQENAVELYRMGAIDRQALLEAVDFPNWKSVLERTGESQLDQAIQILVDAGLEEQDAASLKEYLMQPNQKTGGKQ